jgi:hypothetical protein
MQQASEQLNPYARFLGESDLFAVLESTASHLSSLLGGVSVERLVRRPAPEKWSAREILCHLADTEMVFAFRLRQTAAETHHVIQTFDQDRWAAPYGELTVQDALDAFRAARRWNLLFVRAMGPAVLTRPVTHPERGVMTFQAILETMAGHDVNHLNQLAAMIAE